MKCKRFISMVFALVMALTLAVPVFAAAQERTAVFQATAVTTLPTINVDITNTQSPILLNPYNFVTGTGKTPTSIVSTPIHVKNMTPTDLIVTAAVTGSVAGSVSFSTTRVTSSITAKKAFVYGVFTAQDSAKSLGTAAPSYNANAANQVLVKASTATKKDVVRLPAASTAKPNYLSFEVFGNCTTKPKTAWKESDTLSVAVVYSFRMAPVKK